MPKDSNTARRPSFRQSDLTRAIKAAQAAGLKITRCEIDPEGRIVLCETSEAAQGSALDAWRAKRENRSQGNS